MRYKDSMKLTVVVLTLSLSGCVSSAIDKSVNKCFMFGGMPKWQQADEAGTFECKPIPTGAIK